MCEHEPVLTYNGKPMFLLAFTQYPERESDPLDVYFCAKCKCLYWQYRSLVAKTESKVRNDT
jgi:hypothetical protein